MDRYFLGGRASLILLVLMAMVSGIAVQLNWIAALPAAKPFDAAVVANAVLSIILFPPAFAALRKVIRRIILRLPLPVSVRRRYEGYDTYTYGIFLLTLLGAVGVRFQLPLVVLVVLFFVLLQALLIASLLARRERARFFASTAWLSVLFFLSGFSALTYQIIWERALFTAFGVNIESVTIIVSVFMFGLGVGSLAGGFLSRRFPAMLPHFFLTFEFLTGIFGLISLPLIKAVGASSVNSSLIGMSLAMYALLCIPTMLMGATLPILVAHVFRRTRNVGKSVGLLYFVNTLGSAAACFATANVLFVLFGLRDAIFVAAACNLGVGILMFLYIGNHAVTEGRPVRAEKDLPAAATANQTANISYPLVLVLACMTGYISLSQEMLWIRAVTFATGGRPEAFAMVLGFFLTGISLSALAAKRLSEKDDLNSPAVLGMLMLLSSVAFYVSLPIVGLLYASFGAGLPAAYLLVGINSFFIGCIFPVLCHAGVKSDPRMVGLSMSGVYSANIIGSAGGPLLTGFVLLNVYTLEQNVLILVLLTAGLAALLLFAGPLPARRKLALLGLTVAAAVSFISLQERLYIHLIERLFYKADYARSEPFKYIVQNRAGIITVAAFKTDIIYGEGVYDGQFNIDPVLNTNGIRRAFMIASLHPGPSEVLEIGLSSGSWTHVMAGHSGIKRLSVVEINPGYSGLIRKYPAINSVLSDPKITFFVDDGRRWLNRHPGTRFDLIVWNASFHWRQYATNLLSEDFLRLCKDHLKPGGVVYYNTTWSPDVVYSAGKVFRYVTQYDSFVAASDMPFSLTSRERHDNLMKFSERGVPVFGSPDPEVRLVLESLASFELPDRTGILDAIPGLLRVTDDNMATEFKVGRRWIDPGTGWSSLRARMSLPVQATSRGWR